MTPRLPVFGVALSCIDGRVGQVIHDVLTREWGVDHVDLVTMPGPEAVVPDLAADHDVWHSLRVSVRSHGSTHAAVVAHTDCAANEATLDDRRAQVREAVLAVRDVLHGVDVSGWVVHTNTASMEEVE